MMWNFKQYGKNHIFLSDQGITCTYEEIEKEGEQLVNRIEKRCLVFSLCSNTPGSVLGYTAFLNHQIVPLLLPENLEGDLLLYLMKTYCPKYLWMPEAKAEDYSYYKRVYQNMGYILLETDFTEEYPLYERLALLLTTSGSTGSPKLVRQSYENVRTNAEAIAQYLELNSGERPITTLPMNYTYGLSIINSHLLKGATLLLTDQTLMQKDFWTFFQKAKATSFGGVPYTYEILDKLRFFNMELSSLRTMTQAGGKLSPELHKKFAEYALKTGKNFIVMYGQTEATARMSYLPAEKSLEKYGSMGIAIPGGKFSLIDSNGEEIKEAEVTGELVYEGSNVTLGYAECGKDLQKGDERFGKLITGDMAKRDSEGYYYIVGRKKRFLKIFGNRVNLDEIERIVKEKYEDMDCASSGIDDCMYLFITDSAVIDEVRHYISQKTGLNQIAIKVKAISEIPKSDSGKTLYKKLEQYITENCL